MKAKHKEIICKIREQDPLKQGLKLGLQQPKLCSESNSRARSIKTRIETFSF